ncbi:MAG TPA: hypothetical protein VGF14_03660, partial [Alphaproteobacteria bacterium]
LTDLALGMPIGCYTLAFVILHTVLTTQRRFLIGQGFWLVWPAFALSVLCVYTFVFLLYDATHALQIGWAVWEEGLLGMLMVCLALPVLLPFFHGMQRILERMT